MCETAIWEETDEPSNNFENCSFGASTYNWNNEVAHIFTFNLPDLSYLENRSWV